MAGSEVSRRTLERTPEKALALLRGIGTCPAVHALLAEAGFDQAARDEGWALLRATDLYELTRQARCSPSPTDAPARAALIELEAWLVTGCQRIGAALTRLHPEQAGFVFDRLGPAKGPQALTAVMALLDRLDKLDEGRRKQTREADRAAMATLTRRGITREERARLASLLTQIQTLPPLGEALVPADLEAQQRRALLALYAWYSDWAATARAVLTRREHLIRVGLARRRSAKVEETGDVEAPSTPGT